MRKLLPFILWMLPPFFASLQAQNSAIDGVVNADGVSVEGVAVYLENTSMFVYADSLGYYQLTGIVPGKYLLIAEADGFLTYTQEIDLDENVNKTIDIDLTTQEMGSALDELVISGTMKPVRRLDSPVPVEVYTQEFFKKNPTPNFFDALQHINGVRPQLNCNVCDTGDIHINGLEGAYTMVLIDGMPIVSSLGSVYGLSGIPTSLIERIEVVKGPASSLYGSEAVGGLINIITRNPTHAPLVSADVFTTSWWEHNVDLGFKLNAGKKATVLTGINYFNYQNKVDKNNDNFTDVTLQDRISVFQKWNFQRKNNRLFSLAGRYLYEERWGGDMRWNKSHRGGSEIYGENIYTSRAEIIGNYQLPMSEKMFFNFSMINHDQDSRYGDESYIANQKIGFGQLIWDKQIGKHDILMGAALRYTYYDDNTPATATIDGKNQAEKTWLPGVFIQDEITLEDKHKLLLGFRYDHNNHHGNVFTPRMAYKWTLSDDSMLRLNAGTGFRVVNLFTEDHAALTGAREVVILNDLKPEKSYNVNLNWAKQFYFDSGSFLGIDATAFYTHFTNKIAPDYETNVNQILYDNLEGHAVSKGFSLNVDWNLANGLKFIVGGTLMENSLTENGTTDQQMLTEKFSGTWAVSYKVLSWDLTIDYTGNVYSPMRLPLLGELDPRPEKSPWWSLQNIQLTYDGFDRFEIYGGVKNIFNWTPGKKLPFLIARAHDPFDNNVVFDGDGQAVATPENPYALTFDPSYMYAPNQGVRGFLGMRFKLD